MKTKPDFLAMTLRRYPELPSYSLWRAVELHHLGKIAFPEPILDLACGEGQFGEMLFGVGKRLYGFDLEWKVLRRAAYNPAYSGVVQADATRIPFAAGAFGSVLCNCVLEHIPDDEAAVREAARVLRPGGTAVFTVPGPRLKEGLYNYQAALARGDQEGADDYLREFDRRLDHFHYRTEEEWRRILDESGLQVESIAPYLAAPLISVWDRLEEYLTRPAFRLISQRKFAALILLPRAVRWWLMYRFLLRYYRREEEPADLHGCWLIVGRKP